MTDPKARERLLTILCEKFTDGDMRYQDAADAILAAYPQIAEAPPSGNDAVEAARSILARPQHHIMPEERIAATYILSLAPGKDARERAQAIWDDWVLHSRFQTAEAGPWFIHKVATAITAAVAAADERHNAEVERLTQIIVGKEVAMGLKEAALAAAQKRVGVLKELAREVAYDDGTRETVSEHNAFPFFSKLNQRMCMLRDKARAALAAPGEQVTNDHRAEERG